MGRRVRSLKEEIEWLNNYCREATGIIIDLVAEYKKHCLILLDQKIATRIARLETASRLWDAIKKSKEILDANPIPPKVVKN